MSMATATFFGRNMMSETEEGKAPFWRIVLRGLSQLCFQTNEITGVIFLIAVVTYSWQMAVLALIGAVIGPLVAMGLGADRFFTELGLFGFNSALIGLSFGSFFNFNVPLVIAVIVMAAVAAVLMTFANKLIPFPVVAAPFILTFWAFWPFAEKVGLSKVSLAPFNDSDVFFVRASITAMGAAVFSGTLLAGAIFLLGLLVANWRVGLVAFTGVMLAHYFADAFDAPGDAINSGYLGFNAVLCAVAVYTLAGEDLRLALFGAVGATAMMSVADAFNLVVLASGFVLMFWLILFLGWFGDNIFKAKPTPVEEEIQEAM